MFPTKIPTTTDPSLKTKMALRLLAKVRLATSSDRRFPITHSFVLEAGEKRRFLSRTSSVLAQYSEIDRSSVIRTLYSNDAGLRLSSLDANFFCPAPPRITDGIHP